MLRILFTIGAIVASLFVQAQEIKKSRVVLNNNDVVTGKIIEVIPGKHIKLEIIANNIITLPYDDVKLIYLDESTMVVNETPSGNAAAPKGNSEDKPLSDFYFESNNEAHVAIGVGKIYGLPSMFGTVLNNAVGGGLYSANGVGYKGRFFAGVGIGYNGSSEGQSYSIPYTLDLRYRHFADKKFSPMAMFAIGGEYVEGGLGTFTFIDGIGLSIRFKNRLSAHFIGTHTFVRFMPNLSLENGPLEDLTGNTYFNFVGARLGVSLKI